MTDTLTEATAEPGSEAAPKKSDSLLKTLLWIAAIAWILRSLIVAPFSIPSGSMLPSMMIGDYLFVSKWPYGYSRYSMLFGLPPFDGRIFGDTPERGDVVVFRGPAGVDVVKRVVGLPGDLVAVESGILSINGQPVRRERIADYLMPISPNSPCLTTPPAQPLVRAGEDGRPACTYPAYRETLPGGKSYVTLDQVDEGDGDNFGGALVPQGTVFLMGDNRDNSLDSRFSPEKGGMGFVPIDNIIGRAEFAFWSTDGSASWINPLSWFSALRTDRIGTSYRD
jgi:signal peptidase I